MRQVSMFVSGVCVFCGDRIDIRLPKPRVVKDKDAVSSAAASATATAGASAGASAGATATAADASAVPVTTLADIDGVVQSEFSRFNFGTLVPHAESVLHGRGTRKQSIPLLPLCLRFCASKLRCCSAISRPAIMSRVALSGFPPRVAVKSHIAVPLVVPVGCASTMCQTPCCLCCCCYCYHWLLLRLLFLAAAAVL